MRTRTQSEHARHLGAARVAELVDVQGMDVVMGRREGGRFEDLTTGRWLWNCHSNGGTYNFGHRHPAILESLKEALEDYDIGNHHLLSDVRNEAARRLVGLSDDGLDGVVFAATGTEANELGIRMARMSTRRRGIVTIRASYHGTSWATIAASGILAEGLASGHDDFRAIEWNDLAGLDAIDETTALVMIEAIPATTGFPMPAPSYLREVRRAADAAGALLLVDEVQTGLGRTGQVWSHGHDGISADLLVTGKGLSGGLYPMAALLMNRGVHEWHDQVGRIHVSTFAGSELGCGVVVAVCDLLESEGFLERVRHQARLFRDGLRIDGVELRQRGLVMALRVPGQPHWQTWRRLRKAGVYAMPASFTEDTLQFKPPLILSDSEVDEIIERTRSALT